MHRLQALLPPVLRTPDGAEAHARLVRMCLSNWWSHAALLAEAPTRLAPSAWLHVFEDDVALSPPYRGPAGARALEAELREAEKARRARRDGLCLYGPVRGGRAGGGLCLRPVRRRPVVLGPVHARERGAGGGGVGGVCVWGGRSGRTRAAARARRRASSSTSGSRGSGSGLVNKD